MTTNTEHNADFYERAARSMLYRSHNLLVSAHHGPDLYREICFRLAYLAGKDATRAFAVARSYRLRGQ